MAGNFSATPMQVQCLLRHALAETISEGFINCLIVTNSKEANIQLTRIHEHIFARKCFSFEFFPLYLHFSTSRRPNGRGCMATTDVHRRGGHLHARHGSQHLDGANPARHGPPAQRPPLRRPRLRVPLLTHAPRHHWLGRPLLPRLRARGRERHVPAADRARQAMSQERTRGARPCRMHDVPGARQGRAGQRPCTYYCLSACTPY